jgi:hypothetical protein
MGQEKERPLNPSHDGFLLGILSTNLTSCSFVISFATTAFWNAIRRLLSRLGKKLLEWVATDEAVRISAGANDWMDPNGAAKRADGGVRVTLKSRSAAVRQEQRVSLDDH